MLTASTSWSRGDAGAQHAVLSPGAFWQCGSREPGLSEVRRDFRKLLLASLWTCLALVCLQLAAHFPHAFCQLFKRKSTSEGARFKVSALTLTQASAGSPPFLSFPPLTHNLRFPFQTQSAAEEQGRAPGSARSPWAGWSSTCWRLCLTPIVQPTWLPALQSALGQTGNDTKQRTEQATFVPLRLCATCAGKRFLVAFAKRFPKALRAVTWQGLAAGASPVPAVGPSGCHQRGCHPAGCKQKWPWRHAAGSVRGWGRSVPCRAQQPGRKGMAKP